MTLCVGALENGSSALLNVKMTTPEASVVTSTDAGSHAPTMSWNVRSIAWAQMTCDAGDQVLHCLSADRLLSAGEWEQCRLSSGQQPHAGDPNRHRLLA